MAGHLWLALVFLMLGINCSANAFPTTRPPYGLHEYENAGKEGHQGDDPQPPPNVHLAGDRLMDMTGMPEVTMDMNDMGGMSMQMSFYAGPKATILFEKWVTDTTGEMFGSCVAIIVLAVLYEGFKVLRAHLRAKAAREKKGASKEAANQGDAPQDSQRTSETSSSSSKSASPCSLAHLLQTILHFVQGFVAYVLMLVFMTYNIWLCLAVTGGSALGYFLFGWLRRDDKADDMEHCN